MEKVGGNRYPPRSRLHKLVDCIDIKVYEGVPVREVRNIESTTEDIIEVEYEQVQESEKGD